MKTILLGDIVRVRRGSSPRPIQDYIESNPGIPWVKIADATAANSRFITQTREYIKEKGRGSSVTVEPETLIMSNSATPGLPMIMKINACVHDGWLILDELHDVDRDWLYYYLLNRRVQSAREASGSVFSNLKTDIVRNFKVNLPDMLTQKKAAKILWNIDDKIELNRQMNETLEQMGQALFKHYFIDHPKAKAWKTGKLSDLINIYSGYAFKRTEFDPNGDYGLVTIKNVQEGNFVNVFTDRIASIPVNLPEYINLKTGDILLSLTGNVGRVCVVIGENMLLNQRVAKVEGITSQSFAYFLFRQSEFKDKLMAMSRGTAQLNLSPIETKSMKMQLPPSQTMQEFAVAAEPLFKMLTKNFVENQYLVKLRDSLLPRLISGKIKV